MMNPNFILGAKSAPSLRQVCAKSAPSLRQVCLMFVAVLLSFSSAFAQVTSTQRVCGTPDSPLSNEEFREFCKIRDNFNVSSSRAAVSIPLQFIVVRKTECEEFPINYTAIKNVVEEINQNNWFEHFSFYIAGIKYITNGVHVPLSEADPLAIFNNLGGVTNAINVFVGDLKNPGIDGFANFPYNNNPTNGFNNNIVAVGAFANVITTGSLVHELGHYFGLYHTHDFTSFGWGGVINPNVGQKAEAVARVGSNANCQTTGDLLCSTHADPGSKIYAAGQCYDDCLPVCTGYLYDQNKEAYTPDKYNVMSYYLKCYNNRPLRFSNRSTIAGVSDGQTELMLGVLNNYPNRSFLLNPNGNGTLANNGIESPYYGKIKMALCVQNNYDDNFFSTTKNRGSINYEYKFNGVTVKQNTTACHPDISAKLGTVSVIPSKTDGIANDLTGDIVTTGDIWVLKQHILTAAPITDAFKLIAADVNNSGTLSMADVNEINKAILGLITQFPGTNSYRFIPRLYIEQLSLNINDFKACNPFTQSLFVPSFGNRGYKATATAKSYFDGLDINTVSYFARQAKNWDFYAIKMGDVNCSNSARSISNNPYGLNLIIGSQKQGDEITIIAKSQSELDLGLFQMSLDYDQEKVEVLSISPYNKLPNYSSENHFNYKETGKILTSWFNEEKGDVHLKRGDNLFSIKLKCKQNINNWEEVIKLNTEKFGITIIDDTGENIQGKIMLEAENSIGFNGTIVSFPNPASRTVNFKFESANDDNGIIEITNELGQVVSTQKFKVETGINVITIDDIPENMNGILYYSIKYSSNIFSGKFMKQ